MEVRDLFLEILYCNWPIIIERNITCLAFKVFRQRQDPNTVPIFPTYFLASASAHNFDERHVNECTYDSDCSGRCWWYDDDDDHDNDDDDDHDEDHWCYCCYDDDFGHYCCPEWIEDTWIEDK